MQQPAKARGLVADLWTLLRFMQISGHFMFEYRDGGAFAPRLAYSCCVAFLVVVNFAFIVINMAKQAGDVNDLSANTITTLFFVHSITKLAYFGLRSGMFYRTLATWNQTNSHPLFSESQARFHSLAVTKMRRLMILVCVATIAAVMSWTILTFVGDTTKEVPDPDNGNETMFVDMPRLPVAAWYPWDASRGIAYVGTLAYQMYWLVAVLFHANLLDVLFCCWLIYACEQLVHLKDVMRPLMELSAALDSVVPHSADLFRAVSPAVADDYINEQDVEGSVTIRSIYSNQRDFSGFQRGGGGVGPNGLSKKQEVLVRSAIKYWVERHKHVVRFVGNIGDAYGSALLLHMLTSTVTLTLLAYQATKISAVDVYACSVLGYLGYTLAQVFLFCVFGNRLIEESSSVMEAAYSCHWYDGSEEAKTFVQIVCQQCQKSLSISGAKFFTVSLDLFASVLGAVVTYFMVLVQLK